MSSNLPETLSQSDVARKRILVRLDLDVPLSPEPRILDDSRLENSLPTIQYLLDKKAKVSIIGHLGRPGGKIEPGLKLAPLAKWYEERLPRGKEVALAENLRFNPGEEKNDLDFAKHLVECTQTELYVFDAFAVSHRKHASVMQIPRLLSTAVGFHFEKELIHLNKVMNKPRRPLVFVIGGAKVKTKLPLAGELIKTADDVLMGGLLPQNLEPMCAPGGACITVAGVDESDLDITQESAKRFAQIISQAATVVWNGPMGKFEDSRHELGTKIIAEAVNSTSAFTVVGGGDTEAALSKFGLGKGVDWISSGGGAMLHYLAYGTLPLLEMLERQPTSASSGFSGSD